MILFQTFNKRQMRSPFSRIRLSFRRQNLYPKGRRRKCRQHRQTETLSLSWPSATGSVLQWLVVAIRHSIVKSRRLFLSITLFASDSQWSFFISIYISDSLLLFGRFYFLNKCVDACWVIAFRGKDKELVGCSIYRCCVFWKYYI